MMTLLFAIKDMTWWPFCFQNKDIITLRQAYLSICILCKSDEASCNIFRLQKTLKILEQTLRPENFKSVAHQNLISCRSSRGKHILKIW